MNEAVVVKNVTRVFGVAKALDGVSFALPRRGFVAILGHSGCGKSTLLNILAGLDVDYDGDVSLFGRKPKRMSRRKRRDFRLRTIGYVFQNFNLLELETAERNVMVAMDALYADKAEAKKRKALDLLTFFGMASKAKQQTNTLSGGEKQRVALARALANDPKIVLCDEPTGALDERRAEETFALLRRIAKDRLVLVVSHDRALAERHCDALIMMSDGKITGVSESSLGPKETPPKSFLLMNKKAKGHASWAFLLSHAFHVLKAKPWRALLSQGTIAVGLTGLGLSVYMSSSISVELSSAFSSIVPPGTIVMTPRSGGESPIGAVYGASFEECEYAVAEYGDMVKDYGSDLHLDYESWFTDRNDFTYQSGAEIERLSDFSMRSINDFLWLDELVSPILYPRPPAILYTDQIVLGLPYEHMFRMCLSLHILRNYQSLGEYIDAHGLTLTLHAANYDIGFDDEELFTVVAVTEATRPCVYHLDHRWNRKILIDQMRFRTSLSEETPNPQYIFEIPYLSLTVPESEFLFAARRDPKLSHLVYENANETYMPTVCPIGSSCDVKRLYLYGADKTGASFPELDACMALCPEIAGRQPVTMGSYYAEAGSLAMGFIGKFFLCRDEASAEAVVDSYSDLPYENAFLPGEAIDGAKDGSLLSVGGDGVRLCSPPEGHIPKSPEECYVSSSLYHAWGTPKEIYVAAEIFGEQIGDSYVRRFGVASMKVLGAIDATQDTFFVADDWTVDFFLQELGMSSFSLEPTGAVFYLRDGTDARSVVERLSKAYVDYSFSNPAQEIADSLSVTFGYVGTMLTGFSFIALAMSGLLFVIVMAITMSENEREAYLLLVLGLSDRDIIHSYQAHCLLYAGISLAYSLGMVVFSVYATKFFIAESFHAPLVFALPWEPFAVTVCAGLGLTFFLMLGISTNLRRKITKKYT